MVDFNNRYISIHKEGSTYKSTSGGGTEVYGEIDDESFAHRYNLLTRQDMSRPIASKSVTGLEYSEGGLNLAAQIDPFVANVFRAFFKDTASGTVHTFTEPSGAETLPSFTIQVGRESSEHEFTGMMGNTLSMSATVGEYVMLSADFIGCAQTHSAGGSTLQTPTFTDALDALYFANGSIVFDDGSGNTTASATVKSFSFDINMNRDTDNATALGNATYVRAPLSQRREISGTIELNQVIWGANPTGDDPSYDNLIKADGDLYNPSGATPAIKLTLNEETGSDYIEISFYKVRFEAPDASVSGRDANTMSVNFVALYDAGGADKAMQVKMSGSSLADGTAY
tara:strand:+ start:831 stop:1853 length:1023 start_codon:yes stop_codon:yes gene_type:complete